MKKFLVALIIIPIIFSGGRILYDSINSIQIDFPTPN